MTNEERQELILNLDWYGTASQPDRPSGRWAVAAAEEIERQAKRIKILEDDLSLCQEANRAWLKKSGLSRQDLTQS